MASLSRAILPSILSAVHQWLMLSKGGAGEGCLGQPGPQCGTPSSALGITQDDEERPSMQRGREGWVPGVTEDKGTVGWAGVTPEPLGACSSIFLLDPSALGVA